MLTEASVTSITNNLRTQPTAESLSAAINSNVGASIKDPIGASITKALSNINKLTAAVESKIDNLQQDIVKSTDNTGKVKLVGNKIVITLEPEELSKAESYKTKIQGDINNINSLITKLSLLLNTLSIISQTAQILKTVLDVQEALLNLNPVSKATLSVFKKAIKILFYRDVLSEYTNILSREVASNTAAINSLLNKFKGLSVEFKINSANDSGTELTPIEAEAAIIQDKLGTDNLQNTQNYETFNGKSYNLAVEKYGERELIGRAKDNFSGLLITETAPSFTASPEQLFEELKTILNNY